MRQGDVCSSSYRQEGSETETGHGRGSSPPARALADYHRSAFGALLVGFDRTVYGAARTSIGELLA
jgi:hypothetical protein